MRNFDYTVYANQFWDTETMNLTNLIHEYKGKQELYLRQKPVELERLVEIAKVQSTEASNRIEGIVTTSSRINAIMQEKTTPRNRDECEIAGYRDVLNTVHESHDFIPVRSSYILQLHRDLMQYTGSNLGGQYKITQNYLEETRPDGTKFIRFTPVPPYETEPCITAICDCYQKAIERQDIDSLLLIPIFLADFLCIHPFNDGNGRMSRLLTLLLLYRAGFIIGKYISIEMLIEESKETYYEALQDCSTEWHESNNTYEPFVKYYLGILIKASNEFESRVEYLSDNKISKPERVKRLIQNTVGKINKKEILEKCPDISTKTVERALADLVKEGLIEKVGASSATAYVWIQK